MQAYLGQSQNGGIGGAEGTRTVSRRFLSKQCSITCENIGSEIVVDKSYTAIRETIPWRIQGLIHEIYKSLLHGQNMVCNSKYQFETLPSHRWDLEHSFLDETSQTSSTTKNKIN